jgi:hypothetical protein
LNGYRVLIEIVGITRTPGYVIRFNSQIIKTALCIDNGIKIIVELELWTIIFFSVVGAIFLDPAIITIDYKRKRRAQFNSTLNFHKLKNSIKRKCKLNYCLS